MRIAGGITALAAASMSTSAVAQTAAQAFECALPYRAAMESMKTLTITDQRETLAFFSLVGPGIAVEFAPESTVIYGQTPTRLVLYMREPAEGVTDGVHDITFEATFAREHPIDDALIASNEWGFCAKGIPVCHRKANPEGGPELSYYRPQFWEDGNDPLRLECEYEMREEDLEQ
jgi:hypothetical protein